MEGGLTIPTSSHRNWTSKGGHVTVSWDECEWFREQRAAINKWSFRHHLWQQCWDNRSRMTRECHVRICGSLGGNFPGATRPPLPAAALEEGLEHQPARAAERGSETPYPRGGHLPQRRRNHPTGGCGIAGAGRALAAGRPSHVLSRKHGHHSSPGGTASSAGRTGIRAHTQAPGDRGRGARIRAQRLRSQPGGR